MTNNKPKRKKSEIVIRWIEKNLILPDGLMQGQPFILHDFQREILELIFDNEHPSGTRRAIISLPRRCGKTCLSTALMLAKLCGPLAGENEMLFSTATDKKQASIVYRYARDMVVASPSLNGLIRFVNSQKMMICDELNNTYQSLSREATSALGFGPSFCIFDEVGAIEADNDPLITNLEMGCGSQKNPLTVYISTAAPSDGAFFSRLIDDAKKGSDPRTVVKVYECPANIDAFSPEALDFHPGKDKTVRLEELLEEQAKSKRLPALERDFRNYYLNQRISLETPFISKSIWNEGKAPIDDWRGKDLYIGLDLSSVSDLTALVAMYQGNDGIWNILPFAYLPLDGLDERSALTRTNYSLWHKQGLLTATPGSTIDYEYVARDLLMLDREANIVSVAYDSWRIDALKMKMQPFGLTEKWFDSKFVEMRQGFRTLSEGVNELERLFLEKKIKHGNHAILRECFQNVKVTSDAANNRKFEKITKNRKIDLAVACEMIAVNLANGSLPAPKPKKSYNILGGF